MNACARFEEEGLLAIEAGRPPDPHYEDCPDCRAARLEYERLATVIADAGAEDSPAGDWQARVWSEIRRSEAAPAWRRPWTLVPVGLAAALIAALLVVPRTGGAPELVAAVEPGNRPVLRGVEAHAGDFLVLEARTGGLAHAELRLYKNERELVLRCTGEPPCERRGRRLTARVMFESVGTYQSLLLASDAPIPAPGAGLEADTAAARESGAAVELQRPIEVR